MQRTGNTNWDYVSNWSVNESWESFHQQLNETINTFAPKTLDEEELLYRAVPKIL